MTIPKACELTIHAAIGEGCEVLQMGQSINIVDGVLRLVAKAQPSVTKLLTGFRRGEQMHDVLLCENEPGGKRHLQISHIRVVGLPLKLVLNARQGVRGSC